MATVVVSGALANKPCNGGEAWVRLSWLLGFRKLGFDVHFVEEDSGKEVGEAKRLLVRNEVDLMSASRERDPELRSDGSRSTVRRITRDADLHADLLVRGFIPELQSATTPSQSLASGLTRVTKCGGS